MVGMDIISILDVGAALRNARYDSGLDGIRMILQAHCTQVEMKMQIAKAVKNIAYKPIPFANRDPLRLNEFERLYRRLTAMVSNGLKRVLHEFSLAVPGVRRVGTSKRSTMI
jgi:hypothetical protein